MLWLCSPAGSGVPLKLEPSEGLDPADDLAGRGFSCDRTR